MRNIVTLFTFVVTYSLVLTGPAWASEQWREDTLCGITFSKPEETIFSGFEKAYCVKTTTGARVCSCSKSPDSRDAQIIIEKNGAITQQWNTEFAPPTSLADFRVESADLTGSGQRDIVVATMNGMSNGMGVQYWELRAVVDGVMSKPMIVEDYGIMGFLTRSKSQNKCALLSTRWLWGKEPARGSGLYLTGMWFTYSKNDRAWTPAIDRPAVYRRYLNNFEKLRIEQLNSEHPIPLLWFSDKETKEIEGPYPKFD